MGKSIRSKAKRANRAEFRRTIGKAASDKSAAIVQEKLRECISRGEMNSFERIHGLFHNDNDEGNLNNVGGDNPRAEEQNPIDIDAMDTTDGSGGAVLPNSTRRSKKKTHVLLQHPKGQPGTKLAKQKINKMRRRGKMDKKGQVVRKSWTPKTKKKKGQVSF